MKPSGVPSNISRRTMLSVLAALPVLTGTLLSPPAQAEDARLPSWDDGQAKRGILGFVQETTDSASPNYVPPEDRIATFDQDGTLWVEHPVYSQVLFAFDRVFMLAPDHPDWTGKQPFKAVLARDTVEMAKFTVKELEAIVFATHTGMTVDAFQTIVRDWMAKAKHPRFDKLFSQMAYQPMLELMSYLRNNGYKTYIVTGGGQDFVRAYAQRVYGVPPEQIIGSALDTTYTYNEDGAGVLMREPKLLLNNNFSGKAEDIYLFIGKKPRAAFGNSTGDRQMLEYTHSGEGARLKMLVLHDDPVREYAYGPAIGLPDTEIGTFSQPLYDEAKEKGWIVISMKRDWKRIFPWEQIAL